MQILRGLKPSNASELESLKNSRALSTDHHLAQRTLMDAAKLLRGGLNASHDDLAAYLRVVLRRLESDNMTDRRLS
jgi:hypothetical protein